MQVAVKKQPLNNSIKNNLSFLISFDNSKESKSEDKNSNANELSKNWISTTGHPHKPTAPPPTLGGQRNNGKEETTLLKRNESGKTIESNSIENIDFEKLLENLQKMKNTIQTTNQKEEVAFFAQIFRNITKVMKK